MATDDFEAFDLVERKVSSAHQVYDDYEGAFSGQALDIDVRVRGFLRKQYPNHTLTVTPEGNVNMLAYAAAGHASAREDTEHETSLSFRGYLRRATPGTGDMAQAIRFAKYDYKALDESFVMYYVLLGLNMYQYILKEVGEGESVKSHSKVVDGLLSVIGEWQRPEQTDDIVYVFDGYWAASRDLYKQVQKAKWDDVILDPTMKKSLKDITKKFFDSKDIYDDLGVPWRRGIMFHGPAGNGKTISIKALMKNLHDRKIPIPSLYVKSAPYTYHIRSVFQFARQMAPCMLILEDIDTIVTQATRSYFFNEVDGLETNDGILMVATTNHLERLDPGLSKRPSRFDRKYLFPLPSMPERIQYCNYWRNKLANNNSKIAFPAKLCAPMAGLTDDFSFAYMKEAFIATLLAIAGNRAESSEGIEEQTFCGGGDDDDDIEKYELWREFKVQARILREDMDNSSLRGLSSSLLPSSSSSHPSMLPRPTVEATQPGQITPPRAVTAQPCLNCEASATLPLMHQTHQCLAVETPREALARDDRLGYEVLPNTIPVQMQSDPHYRARFWPDSTFEQGCAMM